MYRSCSKPSRSISGADPRPSACSFRHLQQALSASPSLLMRRHKFVDWRQGPYIESCYHCYKKLVGCFFWDYHGSSLDNENTKDRNLQITEIYNRVWGRIVKNYVIKQSDRLSNHEDELCPDITHDLDNLSAWIDFRNKHRYLHEQYQFAEKGLQIQADGCVEPLTGRRLEGGWLANTASLREGLSYQGICSRIRAVMLVIEQIIVEENISSPAIYAAEAVTAFALRLRGIFPRFIGSEFTLDLKQRRAMYPIPFQDLQNLTLLSESFNFVSTNEVLEHVPSIDRALHELHRVLSVGGWHVGTVPFNYFSDKSLRRAIISEDGSIRHILEPEYHGDPMSEKGVLVFETPGWDIIERAKDAGFSKAFMRFIISGHHGIIDEHIGGVMVFCCQK